MEVNDLVRHRNIKTLGIGCVSKVLKSHIKVNFGLDDTVRCITSELVPVDTSKAKTIPFHLFRSKILNNPGCECPDRVIVGNELLEFVGIGWIPQRVIKEDDLTKYPRVI